MLVNMVTNSTALEYEKETGRIEAFSDDVFAIAITLLILDVKVSRAADLHGGKLGSALPAQWSSHLSYLTSFITVLIMWMEHHKFFRHILRSDSSLSRPEWASTDGDNSSSFSNRSACRIYEQGSIYRLPARVPECLGKCWDVLCAGFVLCPPGSSRASVGARQGPTSSPIRPETH